MTLKAGVVGWPIEHSKSPYIHGFWLNLYGIDGDYARIAIKPENFERDIRALQKQNFRGVNVTIPYKEAAFAICDHVSDRAREIGAVNTLVFKEDGIFGDNTDAYGFMANIVQSQPEWKAKNGPALVIGAGGAARAIIWALKDAGCPEIRLWNRTTEKADTLAQVFGSTVVSVNGDLRDGTIDAHFVVNTTSMGMNGEHDLELDLSKLHPGAVMTDIVYTPLETGLLKSAKAAGYRTVDGLGMLLHQAVPGFEAWFGTRPTVTDELRRLVLP